MSGQRFKYRLERALQISRLKESLKKLEIASLTHRVRFLEDRKGAVDQRIKEVLAKSSTDVAWAPYVGAKLASDLHESRELAFGINEQQESIAARRVELSDLMRHRRALENLRQKRFQEHRIRVRRYEQKKLDELSQLLSQSGGESS